MQYQQKHHVTVWST